MSATRYAVLDPVSHTAAAIGDRFWRHFVATSNRAGVPDCLRKFEQAGSIDNFRILANCLKKSHNGGPNNNELVYRSMEACDYYTAADSEEVVELLKGVNDLVCGVQAEDGYINTYYDNPDLKREGVKDPKPAGIGCSARRCSSQT